MTIRIALVLKGWTNTNLHSVSSVQTSPLLFWSALTLILTKQFPGKRHSKAGTLQSASKQMISHIPKDLWSSSGPPSCRARIEEIHFTNLIERTLHGIKWFPGTRGENPGKHTSLLSTSNVPRPVSFLCSVVPVRNARKAKQRTMHRTAPEL